MNDRKERIEELRKASMIELQNAETESCEEDDLWRNKAKMDTLGKFTMINSTRLYWNTECSIRPILAIEGLIKFFKEQYGYNPLVSFTYDQGSFLMVVDNEDIIGKEEAIEMIVQDYVNDYWCCSLSLMKFD